MLDGDAVAKLELVVDNLLSDAALEAFRPELDFVAFNIDEDTPSRLQTFYDQHIETFRLLGMRPTTDLAKCIAVDRFLRKYASDDVRAEYALLPRDSYLSDLLDAVDGSVKLEADLSDSPVLIPAQYSWICPFSDVETLSAADVISRLRLRGAIAPLVLLRLGEVKMADNGVTVRAPNAIDTIPAIDDHWVQGAVPNELVDRDIPRVACEEIRCLP